MPITPVFEQPPVNPRGPAGIDWTDTIAALVERPGEWARVDGPWPLKATGAASSRMKSLRKWGQRVEVAVEARTAVKDGERWMYARVVAETKPEPKAKKDRPDSASGNVAPMRTPEAPRTEFGGDHDCDECGATFRTNTRLRQHQANAHKAS